MGTDNKKDNSSFISSIDSSSILNDCRDVARQYMDEHLTSLRKLSEAGDVESLKQLMSLAEGGNTTAQGELGEYYYDKADFTESAKWLMKAAISGHPRAQFLLSLLYTEGKGVPKSEVECFKWLKTSATDINSISAQFNLAEMHRALIKNYGEAIELYKVCVDHGHVEAMASLGWMYCEGQGVSKSKSEGKKLLQRAVDGGSQRAKEMLDLANTSLGKEMAKGALSATSDSVKNSIRMWKR